MNTIFLIFHQAMANTRFQLMLATFFALLCGFGTTQYGIEKTKAIVEVIAPAVLENTPTNTNVLIKNYPFFQEKYQKLSFRVYAVSNSVYLRQVANKVKTQFNQTLIQEYKFLSFLYLPSNYPQISQLYQIDYNV